MMRAVSSPAISRSSSSIVWSSTGELGAGARAVATAGAGGVGSAGVARAALRSTKFIRSGSQRLRQFSSCSRETGLAR